MGTHSSDLSIITAFVAKTFFNVRCRPCRHFWIQLPGQRPMVPTTGRPFSSRTMHTSTGWGGWSAVSRLALMVQVPEPWLPRWCILAKHRFFALCSLVPAHSWLWRFWDWASMSSHEAPHKDSGQVLWVKLAWASWSWPTTSQENSSREPALCSPNLYNSQKYK